MQRIRAKEIVFRAPFAILTRWRAAADVRIAALTEKIQRSFKNVLSKYFHLDNELA
jgi:hypothetical protein